MKKVFLIMSLLVVVAVLGAACNAPAPAPAPVDHVAAGRQLYIDKGCAVCHGQNAEGTDIAPALPGHNVEQVMRQVRSPVGSMPRSSPEQISADELGVIADYIESLEPVAEHREPAAMDDALVVHHWMALYALESDIQADAKHHVIHILELVTDPEHTAQMEEVLVHIQAGDFHDASHAIEEMLAEKAAPALSLKNMHLQLALASIRTSAIDDAKHHLEHFIDLATGDEKARGEEAIDLLEQGRIYDAEHEVEELLE